jgi:hypothetical protein
MGIGDVPMNIEQASLEFHIRYYRWAKSKAHEEVNESFPHFWLFKGGVTWQEYNYMRQLERNKQYAYAMANVKHAHRYAAKALGEPLSGEEEALLDRARMIKLQPSDLEKELAARRRMGEKIKFASKRRLQKAMIAAFQRAFDPAGLETSELPGYPVPFLKMKCCGWIVQTNFTFGRTQSLIEYDHLICSEERFPHPTTPGVDAPVLVLAIRLCWIWLCVMKWEYLMEEDVEPACDSVVALCRELFDELPRLLKGLERENVTAAVKDR